MTIELVDVPEARALRTLLRTASGYLAAPRAAISDGVSHFDRILILATSKPAERVSTVASPARAVASPPAPAGAFGQRLGVVPDAPGGRTPFTVSPAQQDQLDQLQRLLQQSDDARTEPPQPVTVQPSFGTVPATRPGMPMRSADPGQQTGSVPTGPFGSTTPVPETNGAAETAIPSPRP